MKLKKLALTLIGLSVIAFVSCDFHGKDKNNGDEYLLEWSSTVGTSEFPLNDGQKMVLNMGLGWNLGNTLDAYNNQNHNLGLETETTWGQPKTTKAMIDGLADAGIKTIRMPVSWHDHFTDQNYTIDSQWMARVKQIVDWALDDGMYVILNVHHDDSYYKTGSVQYNEGFYPLRKDQTESEKFLKNVWTQVGNTFKDYDEKLIFETMNEPRLRSGADGSYPCESGNHEWWLNTSCSTCLEAEQVLLEYNQLCIDTIRGTGGKNATDRYISCPNLCASPDAAFHLMNGTKTFIELLTDSIENHLILSVHMYTPYSFAMQYPGDSTFKTDHQSQMTYYFNNLIYFIKKGYPVIIGETGATDKNNLKERAKWYAFFTGGAKIISATCCIWDNGNTNPGEDAYGFYNRNSKKFSYPLLLDIALKQTDKSTDYILNNIENQ